MLQTVLNTELIGRKIRFDGLKQNGGKGKKNKGEAKVKD